MNYGYARVSTKKQVDNGFSIDDQVRLIETKFNQSGIKNFEIIIDDGYTGTSMDRPGLRRIISDMERGIVDTILFTKLDRLFRNNLDFLNFIEKAGKTETKFQSILEHVNVDTAMGKLFATFMGAMSETESAQISERTKRGLYEKAKQGQYPFAHNPMGYNKDEYGKLHTNEDMDIVLFIFNEYAKGYTVPELKIMVENRYDTCLGVKRIEKLFTTNIYRGFVEINGHGKVNIVPPILDFDVWDKAKKGRKVTFKKVTKTSKNIYKYRNRVFLDDNRLFHTTQYKENKEYRYYYLRKTNENGLEKSFYISENQLEHKIVVESMVIDRYIAKKIKQLNNLLIKDEICELDFLEMRHKLLNQDNTPCVIKKIILNKNYEVTKIIFDK